MGGGYLRGYFSAQGVGHPHTQNYIYKEGATFTGKIEELFIKCNYLFTKQGIFDVYLFLPFPQLTHMNKPFVLIFQIVMVYLLSNI